MATGQTATFTWLHFTDLHIGQPLYGHDPRNIRTLLVEDLNDWYEKTVRVPPDVVFFTGDLAFSGSEYLSDDPASATVDGFLAELWNDLPWDPKPPLAVVPGNHDLRWTKLTDDEQILWERFHDEDRVRNQLMKSARRRATKDRYWLHDRIVEAFSNYTSWLGSPKTQLPFIDRKHPTTPGLFPGEYASTLTTADGLKVGIAALNSAYWDIPILHHRPREGSLALYPDQLDGFDKGFADWSARHNVCLALTHHPPSWFAPRAVESLQGFYFSGKRLALHLCGHLHSVDKGRWGRGWNDQTLVFQGRSLFGVEPSEIELSESFGYTAGQITFTKASEEARLRIFPRCIVRVDGGFDFRGDIGTRGDSSIGDKKIEVRRWPAARVTPPPPPAAELPAPAERVVKKIVDHLKTGADPRWAFVFGPRGYGKTISANLLTQRLEAAGFVVSRNDLAELDKTRRKSADAVLQLLCRRHYERATGSLYTVPPDGVDFAGCMSQCLRAAKSPEANQVMIVDSFHTLAGQTNFDVQHKIRTGLEPHIGRLHLVVFAALPRERAVPSPPDAEPDAPSPLGHFLEPFPIDRFDKEAVRALTKGKGESERHPELLDWLLRYTGGHPGVLWRLLQAFNRLGPNDWPQWARSASSDAEREAGLHGADGPLAETVQGIKTILEDAARFITSLKQDPKVWPPGGLVVAGQPIPIVARLLDWQ